MKLEFKPEYLLGMGGAMLLVALDFYLFVGMRWFWPLLIVAVVLSLLQFWVDYIRELRRQKEIDAQFLEFIRNLVESVKSGISIPKSIMHVAKSEYGALTPYVKKLAHQIEWGIPTNKALITFSLDTYNPVIKRSISIIIEAEQSGGDIRDILSSVVGSVVNVKKMKEERKASVFSQVVQGYIIFYIFIAIMLALQVWLFPKLLNLSGSLGGGVAGSFLSGSASAVSLNTIFFSLVMIQGFFAGIMIGKFSEGTLKNGLIHSAVLMVSSALIITVVKGGI